MSPKSPSSKHTPTAFLPLATAFESLSQRRAHGGIDAVAVQRALGLRSLFLADRLLAALGGAHRRFETAEEFVAVAQRLMAAKPAEKLEFLFRLHDVDGDGCITRPELDCLMHIVLAENDLKLPPDEADRLVDAVMKAGDLNGDGKITAGEFVTMMAAHPDLQRRLTEYGVSLLMPGKRARARALPPGSVWGGRVRSGALLGAWVVAWAAVNVALFADAFLRYRHAGASVFLQVARGAGATLNLNAALIVVPMLRHTLTWVRRSALGRVVPVDDFVGLHGLLGEAVVALSLVHAGAHVLNARAAQLASFATFAPWAFATATRANATGAALLAIFLVIWAFSRRYVRRSGRFELFHLTHLGYLASVPLLFMHGPRFWMWGTLPWLWYFIERAVRANRRHAPCRIFETTPMASGVTRLVFDRPARFRYAAGDYVFIRIPAVARTEWHPFTLTSAPEDPTHLAVHIRAVGNWSSAVVDRVAERERDGLDSSIYVDGPYGSATRDIFEAAHAVAIAGGIGVTPFASVLAEPALLARARRAPAQAALRLARARPVLVRVVPRAARGAREARHRGPHRLPHLYDGGARRHGGRHPRRGAAPHPGSAPRRRAHRPAHAHLDGHAGLRPPPRVVLPRRPGAPEAARLLLRPARARQRRRAQLPPPRPRVSQREVLTVRARRRPPPPACCMQCPIGPGQAGQV
jgi:predicted ferric reductase/Ca2+-binding EF-hand superfamily protein